MTDFSFQNALPQDFFARATEKVARDLLGAVLVRRVGDTVHATPALDGGYRVLDVQKERCLVLGAETDRMGGHIRTSWSFVLEPIGGDATHLVTRVRGIGDPPWSAWLQGAVLFPPIHALMQHAQLKNLKKLVEEQAWARVGEAVST